MNPVIAISNQGKGADYAAKSRSGLSGLARAARARRKHIRFFPLAVDGARIDRAEDDLEAMPHMVLTGGYGSFRIVIADGGEDFLVIRQQRCIALGIAT